MSQGMLRRELLDKRQGYNDGVVRCFKSCIGFYVCLGRVIMDKQIPTWHMTGARTLLTLFLSILAGIILMGRRVFLSPPIASYTLYFYLAVVILPSLIVFTLHARRRPAGSRTMLIILPILAVVLICFYITLIGPAFYVDIQCQRAEQTLLIARLDCQCEYAVSGGTTQAPCAAKQLWPVPLIWLIEEHR